MAKFSNGYTIGFAAAVCIVCSIAVSVAARSLKDIQDLNEQRDVQKSILGALGLPEAPEGQEAPALVGEQIDALYAERIKVLVIDDQGAVQESMSLADLEAEQLTAEAEGREPKYMGVYARMDGEQVGAFAIPMDGVGLWGPINGYLAIEPNGETVMGATFFAPKETPGLGYEITMPVFTEQFPGKKLVDGGKPRPIRVIKGKAADVCPGAEEFCVDGISGSTLTCNGVDDMLVEALEVYEPYLAKVRSSAGGAR